MIRNARRVKIQSMAFLIGLLYITPKRNKLNRPNLVRTNLFGTPADSVG